MFNLQLKLTVCHELMFKKLQDVNIVYDTEFYTLLVSIPDRGIFQTLTMPICKHSFPLVIKKKTNQNLKIWIESLALPVPYQKKKKRIKDVRPTVFIVGSILAPWDFRLYTVYSLFSLGKASRGSERTESAWDLEIALGQSR